MNGVSVVLPTHNRAGYVGRAVRSVLAQSLAPAEVIVVDDASTDDTADVIAAIGDSRVRLVRLPARAGASAARNHGLELARGEWVAFQDSDDQWRPAKLERQAAALQDGVALVVTNMDVTGGYPRARAAPRPDGRTLDITDTVQRWLPGTPTWLASRERLRRAGGFDELLNCHEDWDLALRLAQQSRILMVNEALVVCDRAPGSLFEDERGRWQGLRRVVERHGATLSRDAVAWAYYCNVLGQGEAMFGSMTDARRWFRHALRTRPTLPRTWANLAFAALGQPAFSRYVRIARTLRHGFAG